MEKEQIKRSIKAGVDLNYDYVCSASGLGFIRVYTGNLQGEIDDALNEILYQDWFIDCETNDFITEDKLFKISDIPLFDVYYRELPNVYELLISNAANNKLLFTVDIVDWDEFFNALEKYEIG